MSASNWSLAQDGTGFAFRRGFTGLEHYDRSRPRRCSYRTAGLDLQPDLADVRLRAAGLDLQSRPIEYKDFQSAKAMN